MSRHENCQKLFIIEFPMFRLVRVYALDNAYFDNIMIHTIRSIEFFTNIYLEYKILNAFSMYKSLFLDATISSIRISGSTPS